MMYYYNRLLVFHPYSMKIPIQVHAFHIYRQYCEILIYLNAKNRRTLKLPIAFGGFNKSFDIVSNVPIDFENRPDVAINIFSLQ